MNRLWFKRQSEVSGGEWAGEVCADELRGGGPTSSLSVTLLLCVTMTTSDLFRFINKHWVLKQKEEQQQAVSKHKRWKILWKWSSRIQNLLSIFINNSTLSWSGRPYFKKTHVLKERLSNVMDLQDDEFSNTHLFVFPSMIPVRPEELRPEECVTVAEVCACEGFMIKEPHSRITSVPPHYQRLFK